MKAIVDVKIPYLGEVLIVSCPRQQSRLEWEYNGIETIIRWGRFEMYLVRGEQNGHTNRKADQGPKRLR